MSDTFRLGAWRTSTHSTSHRVAEGVLLFASERLQITVALHRRDGTFWLTFPKSAKFRDPIALRGMTQAVVAKLKAERSGTFWRALDRVTGQQHSAKTPELVQRLRAGDRL